MISTEAACYSTPEEAGLRVKTLPFDSIPHQSKLFLDYLHDPVLLRKYYPNAVQYHHELAQRASDVLREHKTDRAILCDALQDMNNAWGARPETLANISRLREADCVVVVSGQQAGLFTGPLYTIYKALSAVKLAGCLSQRGTPAVPVFWIATEDHDFPEVATAELIGCDCNLTQVTASSAMHSEGTPVGRVTIDESINDTIAHALEILPKSEFTSEIENLLRDAWQPGKSYGDAFARMLSALLGRHGLILLDPLNPRLKELASPLYAAAALRARQIADALVVRSRELEDDGYHAQVMASSDTFPLFLHSEDGTRHALARTENNNYRIKDSEVEYSAETLADWAVREPNCFSPNVTLRAVVQDYLLPTVAYFGGAAEIAYFAQTAEVYRLLDRPVTPILPRASMTIVESRTGHTLERYNLELSDLFAGIENVLARVVEEYLGTETGRAFEHADETINGELDRLRERLHKIDPTLADALDTGRRKINYQLNGLRTRFHRAQMNRDEAIQRQIERAFSCLYPEKTLQERRLNISSLIARHGHYVIDWIYDAINLGSTDHQVVYL